MAKQIFITDAELQGYIPQPTGLDNITGSLCYFNALTQGLLSCPILRYYCGTTKSESVNEVLKLFACQQHRLDVIYNKTQQVANESSNFKLQGQSDGYEALLCLLEVINREDKDIYKLIYTCLYYRYGCKLKCMSCGKLTAAADETNVSLDVSREYPRILDNITRAATITDRHCDNKSCPTYMEDNLRHRLEKTKSFKYPIHQQLYEIVRLGPILFVHAKKYNDCFNLMMDQSEELLFPGEDNTVHKYTLVAQIDRSGDPGGNSGHYYGIFRRKSGLYAISDSSVTPVLKFNINANTYMTIYVFSSSNWV